MFNDKRFLNKWVFFAFIMCFFFIFSQVIFSKKILPEENAQFSSADAAFVYTLLTDIRTANADIRQQRQKLLKLYQTFNTTQSLSDANKKWLLNLSKKYDLKNFTIHSKSNWKRLINRVDTVPASLVIAQAANESAWGRSRFARIGDNEFGVWCYTPRCGLVPSGRPKGASYEVRKYPSQLASVVNYLHIINTKSDYQNLRNIRAKLRAEHKPVLGSLLAAGLLDYSTKRGAYVEIIKDIISRFQLERFDYQQ